MTAAERQRRRRARLRADNPPARKPGRPRFGWLKPSDLELFQEAMGDDSRRMSARRRNANHLFRHFGRQVLHIEPLIPDKYSPEDAKRFEPLARKKGIIEQFGRHVVFMMNVVGCNPDEAKADARQWAEDLLIDERTKGLNVADVVGFFRWLRGDVGEQDEAP
jgi:hypothetical protein